MSSDFSKKLVNLPDRLERSKVEVQVYSRSLKQLYLQLKIETSSRYLLKLLLLSLVFIAPHLTIYQVSLYPS